LPLSVLANPMNCPGDQIAKLRIPESAPNGPAALEWYVKLAALRAKSHPYRQCSGANGVAVDLMVISGGFGDWERFADDSEAVRIAVQCRSNTTDQSRTNVTCK
jgi:hypothetical protein